MDNSRKVRYGVVFGAGGNVDKGGVFHRKRRKEGYPHPYGRTVDRTVENRRAAQRYVFIIFAVISRMVSLSAAPISSRVRVVSFRIR